MYSLVLFKNVVVCVYGFLCRTQLLSSEQVTESQRAEYGWTNIRNWSDQAGECCVREWCICHIEQKAQGMGQEENLSMLSSGMRLILYKATLTPIPYSTGPI